MRCMELTIDMIDDGVWVGPAPRREADYCELARLGIQDILTLQTEDEARACGIPPDEAATMASSNGLSLVRVPIRDFDPRSMSSNVPTAVRTLQDLRQRGRVVYVHCHVGINRAPTVVAAYLALTHQIGGAQACGWLLAIHPSAPDQHVVGTIAGR